MNIGLQIFLVYYFGVKPGSEVFILLTVYVIDFFSNNT